MDRMRFIPGREAREEIHNTGGRITVDHDVALGLADEFILPGATESITYMTALAALSKYDTIEILFGLRNPKDASEEVPSGELVGFTTANFVPAQGEKRMLWETGRRCELFHESYARRAFAAYKAKLVQHLAASSGGQAEIVETTIEVQTPENPTTISRALSPTSIYCSSGAMFYFVDLAPPPGSSAYIPGTTPRLTRPMRASDALPLSALMTLVWHRPPVVFAVMQSVKRLGAIPARFKRVEYTEAEDAWPVDEGDDVSIVI